MLCRLSSVALRSGTPGVLWLAALWAVVHAVLLAGALLRADDDAPPARLIDQEPYDELVLRDPPDTVLKLVPVDLPGRVVPVKPQSNARLTVRLWDRPNDLFEVTWREVVELRLFEQMVLAETEEHVAAKRFAAAYDNLVFLERRYPSTPGLKEGLEQYLFAEGRAALADAQVELALASLYALHERNPDFAGLQEAIGTAVDRQVTRLVAGENHAAARRMLSELADRYQDDPVVNRWHDRFRTDADALVAKAEQHQAEGRARDAQQACRAALALWPEHQRARELIAQVHASYPTITVGVTALPTGAEGPWLADWTARRTMRLTGRRLFEPVSFGPEGGRYFCPWGIARREDLGRRLIIDLGAAAISDGSLPLLTGYDLARRLRMAVHPGSAAYDQALGELLVGIAVEGVWRVDLELARADVRPEAWLESIVPTVPSAGDGAAPGSGPYTPSGATGDEAVFRFAGSLGGDSAKSIQPREIAELRFATADAAIAAIDRGDVAVLDRVMPWRFADLSERRGLVVGSYAAPTLHCLIPSRGAGPIANRALRRAIAYGLPREAILRDRLSGGAAHPESQVASGPFPRGYAYNDAVSPRPYDRRLALTLVEVARRQLAKQAAADGTQPSAADEQDAGVETSDGDAEEEQAVSLPPLVLGHPGGELATIACRAIQEQLAAISIEIELRQADPAKLWSQPGDFDLIYAELAMWEPVVDVHRLLAPDGPVSQVSPYLRAALRELVPVQDWRAAAEKLHEIHRIVHEELTILPLWQLAEHFAYRDDVEGLGRRPVTLYQNVESWRSAPPIPAEAR